MKIGFAGTMSVGKTTLVNELAKLDQFSQYYIATERSKYLRDLGIPLNRESSVNGQMVFMAERATELLHEHLLTDRTIWDVNSFTFVSKSISASQKSRLMNCGFILKDQYDVVFYVSPVGVLIEDNQIRTTDANYRVLIDDSIKYLLEIYPPKKLITIEGSNEKRISDILKYINEEKHIT